MEEEKKRKYEKPVFEKEEGMTFPIEIIDALGHPVMCLQCSSCHGCH